MWKRYEEEIKQKSLLCYYRAVFHRVRIEAEF